MHLHNNIIIIVVNTVRLSVTHTLKVVIDFDYCILLSSTSSIFNIEILLKILFVKIKTQFVIWNETF